MKNVILTMIVVVGFATTTIKAQVINKLEIKPVNPTEVDTIMIISDFSYKGNCVYGFIGSNNQLDGSIINVMPLYCGYGDSTLCNTIDTFKVGPFSIGNYKINIDYHQGSICPYSGFDATIAHFDTSVVISAFNSLPHYLNSNISIYPNPSTGKISVRSNFKINSIDIDNMYGAKLGSSFDVKLQSTNEVDLSHLTKGVYFAKILIGEKIYIRKIVLN